MKGPLHTLTLQPDKSKQLGKKCQADPLLTLSFHWITRIYARLSLFMISQLYKAIAMTHLLIWQRGYVSCQELASTVIKHCRQTQEYATHVKPNSSQWVHNRQKDKHALSCSNEGQDRSNWDDHVDTVVMDREIVTCYFLSVSLYYGVSGGGEEEVDGPGNKGGNEQKQHCL